MATMEDQATKASSAESAESTPTFTPRALIRRNPHDRLSIELLDRIGLAAAVGAASGFGLGLIKGTQDTALRFRAEHAHRLPTSQTGWYFYHKSKNYNMMFGGLGEGWREARKYAFWTALFFVLEEGLDRGRAFMARMIVEYKTGSVLRTSEEQHLIAGQRDALSSMLAGLGTAGAFSFWSRFPVATAARTVRMGAFAGLGFGLTQDALSLLQGRRVGYVDVIRRAFGGNETERAVSNEVVLPEG